LGILGRGKTVENTLEDAPFRKPGKRNRKLRGLAWGNPKRKMKIKLPKNVVGGEMPWGEPFEKGKKNRQDPGRRENLNCDQPGEKKRRNSERRERRPSSKGLLNQHAREGESLPGPELEVQQKMKRPGQYLRKNKNQNHPRKVIGRKKPKGRNECYQEESNSIQRKVKKKERGARPHREGALASVTQKVTLNGDKEKTFKREGGSKKKQRERNKEGRKKGDTPMPERKKVLGRIRKRPGATNKKFKKRKRSSTRDYTKGKGKKDEAPRSKVQIGNL